MLEGRSSIGRLGVFIHVTAGFGDVGFKGYWTLEIFCVQPVRIYAGVEVCQNVFPHHRRPAMTAMTAANIKTTQEFRKACCIKTL